MNQNQLVKPGVTVPSLDIVQLKENLKQDRFRVREMLDDFVTNSVDTLDAISLAFTEGKKDAALTEIHDMMELSREIHADALTTAMERLRLAIINGEDTISIRKNVATSQTTVQGTLALVKEFLISQG